MNEAEEDRLAWVYWGPKWNGMKVFNPGNLGEIVLGSIPKGRNAEAASR
jgi:hypothetical protein